MTAKQLKEIMPYATAENVTRFLAYLNGTMETFEINTPLRQVHFLAQLAHESGSLRYVRELASGKAYEGRKDLGNLKAGDGVKYKGRGLIQLTGRANYEAFNDWLDRSDVNVVDHPEQLEEPELAALVAGWFWNRAGLNKLADKDDLKGITKKINGGLNGFDDRKNHLIQAKKVLYV
ncbi:MAG: hypothetical protein RSH25_13660 [Bacteroides sp.]|uniref:glycoside hydrolase family 19 protein n=1 Tax=Bacteroides sp. TaxID=29523 RepID=UPI002FC7E252